MNQPPPTTPATDSNDVIDGEHPQHERFRTQVTVGTLVGIAICLLFAALLMLLNWQPRIGGNSVAGQFGGQGTGNGLTDGDGKARTSGDTGDGAFAVAGRPDSISDQSAGSDGTLSAVETLAETPGTAPQPTDENAPTTAMGTDAVADDRRAARTSLIVQAPELLVPDPADEDGWHRPANAMAGMFAGRNAEQRQQLAESEGGSAASEAAVELGLKWLARHQHDDGHWSLDRFHTTGECNGQCSRHTGTASDAAGTGFGLLPFLGAGYTHKSGKYRSTVQSGLDWLISDQTKEGTFQHCNGGTLYAHGIATIALCEAWAMTRDPRLKQPAQQAINFTIQAQHAQGGWRYAPRSPGDTSVTGWQVIALRSAQQGGLRVPGSVMRKVSEYLDSVQTDKQGSGYRYMPGNRVTDAMVAEGLLCRIYSSPNPQRAGLEAGVEYLRKHPPRAGGELYYYYYATQVMHHYGGEPWQEWNPVMRDLLIEQQATTGHENGSWAPQGGHDVSGGRLYATSLALLTLEVYYRHKREL